MQIRQIEGFHGWAGLGHNDTSLEGSRIEQVLEGIVEGGRVRHVLLMGNMEDILRLCEALGCSL